MPGEGSRRGRVVCILIAERVSQVPSREARPPLSKKHQHRGPSTSSTAELKARIDRTRREGRFQQALDLVKQLHKAEPRPDHFELLKDTYFQRAVQLRTQGQSRDAANVLEVALRLDEKNAAWLEKLAGEMALCGDVARSMQILGRLPS